MMAYPRFLTLACVTLILAACDGSSNSTPEVLPSAPSVLMPRPGGTVNSNTVQVELPPIADAVRYEIALFGSQVAPARAAAGTGDEVALLSMVAPLRVIQSTTGSASFENVADGRYSIRYDAFDQNDQVIGRSSFDAFRVLDVQEYYPTTEVTVFERGFVQPGYRLLNIVGAFDGRQMMSIVNLEGETIWNWEGPETPGILMAPTVLQDGSGIRALRLFQGSDRLAGWIFEVDWDGNITYEAPLPNDNEGRRIVPHHELDTLPDGRFFYLGWEWRDFPTGPGGAMETAEGDIIQIFNPVTGQLDWSWSLFDHFTPLTRPVPEQAQVGASQVGSDWSHCNGIDWDPTNQMFWLSVRHFDAFLGVRYPSGTVVEIGPEGIGGFMFSHQHAPEVQADGSILFWDNGNITNPPQPYLSSNYVQVSSVRQIEVDLNAQTANTVFSWSDGLYDAAIGDADRLPNGNILVAHGISQKVVELDPQGNKVWELQTTSTTTEFFGIYRSDWVDPQLLPADLR